jgi:predicted PhzF superfamily epimerase YddE/YHI9
MQLDFVAVDVFTDQQFGGNPLTVVLNGHGGLWFEMLMQQ